MPSTDRTVAVARAVSGSAAAAVAAGSSPAPAVVPGAAAVLAAAAGASAYIATKRTMKIRRRGRLWSAILHAAGDGGEQPRVRRADGAQRLVADVERLEQVVGHRAVEPALEDVEVEVPEVDHAVLDEDMHVVPLAGRVRGVFGRSG